jgi:hypothetical protein
MPPENPGQSSAGRKEETSMSILGLDVLARHREQQALRDAEQRRLAHIARTARHERREQRGGWLGNRALLAGSAS